MKFDKALVEKVKTGEATEQMLIENIMSLNPLTEIMRFVIETLKTEPVVNTPITVSMEEYERITSLFRIKGLKIVDGQEVVERRGRPSKK